MRGGGLLGSGRGLRCEIEMRWGAEVGGGYCTCEGREEGETGTLRVYVKILMPRGGRGKVRKSAVRLLRSAWPPNA
jgi:hypothetical protein